MPHDKASKECAALVEKKAPWLFLSLSLSFFLLMSRRQSIIQNQTLLHLGQLALGKPPYAILR
jgi:hypothetical protein